MSFAFVFYFFFDFFIFTFGWKCPNYYYSFLMFILNVLPFLPFCACYNSSCVLAPIFLHIYISFYCIFTVNVCGRRTYIINKNLYDINSFWHSAYPKFVFVTKLRFAMHEYYLQWNTNVKKNIMKKAPTLLSIFFDLVFLQIAYDNYDPRN